MGSHRIQTLRVSKALNSSMLFLSMHVPNWMSEWRFCNSFPASTIYAAAFVKILLGVVFSFLVCVLSNECLKTFFFLLLKIYSMQQYDGKEAGCIFIPNIRFPLSPAWFRPFNQHQLKPTLKYLMRFHGTWNSWDHSQCEIRLIILGPSAICMLPWC